MYIKNQKFLVLGVSKSGFAVANYILSNGGKCFLYEQLSSEKIDSAISKLIDLGAVRVNKDNIDNILPNIDVVVVSPGVPINHHVAVKSKSLGKRIIGELEFGYLQFLPTIVGITGTNGKTTTATLIDAILIESGAKSMLVGNVGVPLTNKVCDADSDSICVTEVSSFQLETTSSFCPHISCILNIAPDHLERHYTMENYIFLKKRIFKNQKESEYTILNYDDETVRNFSSEVKAKIKYVSLKGKIEGAYRLENKLYYNDEFIISEESLSLKGEHNVYNTLFAICVCKLLGIDNQSIINALINFKGVKHRMELIANIGGVDYYNDSKATNTASTITAVENMKKPTILILGGSDKGENYKELFDIIKSSSVRHVIIMGATRLKMFESAVNVGYTNITLTYDFTTAVKIAKLIATDGECVLLSPACASFDSFSSFEERGDRFRELVQEV
ncbi:MAG: UDP-N-acetylmuramoyl-L-alanine--D-glutamate ligase [Clostridiales bacterium]|nr:UDP-N-acetylmuramoyl-L-alanine--D-glutamate ligase [Clostridiales bacterium]